MSEPFAQPSSGLRGAYGTVPSSLTAPATTPKTITGRVTSYGTSIAGSGYGVAHSGTGIYLITFTVPFTTVPTVTVSGVVTGATSNSWGINPTLSQVTVYSQTGGVGAVDQAFNFVAQTTV